MTPARLLAPALLLAAALACPAAAQVALGGLSTDPTDPVEVEAEELSVDQATGAATFSGGVTVGQGDLRLQAATVEVLYAEGAIVRLLASGGVTLATPQEAAEAETADYDLQGRTLTMEGDVLFTQGSSALSAGRMVIDLAAGTARLEGGVRTVLGATVGAP
jgi:lipopolysaccharide export system protein LptA